MSSLQSSTMKNEADTQQDDVALLLGLEQGGRSATAQEQQRGELEVALDTEML